MKPESVLDRVCPGTWQRFGARRVFMNSTERSRSGDIQLSASQRLGVVPQAFLMAEEEQKYMLALSGTENFKHVEIGDFVISLRSFEGGFEYSAFSGCVSPAYTVLRPKLEIDGSFFRYLFKSEIFKQMLAVFNVGIRDGKSIRYEDFSEFTLAFPSLKKQQNLASYLDHETARIDALATKKLRFIDLLHEKRQALITHAVTKGLDPTVRMKDSGVEWLGDVPEHWNVCSIQHIIDRIEQGWSPQCLNRPAAEGQWGVVKSGCVNGGFFSDNENKALPPTLSPLPEHEIKVGNILMSRASGSPDLIGSVALVTHTKKKLMLSDKIFRIHCSPKILTTFFVWMMGSYVLRSQIRQAISGAEGLANNLPQSRIKKFSVVCPSTNEQASIVEFIGRETTRIDTLIQKTERSIELLKERRAALITAAVTGQIDLREPA